MFKVTIGRENEQEKVYSVNTMTDVKIVQGLIFDEFEKDKEDYKAKYDELAERVDGFLHKTGNDTLDELDRFIDNMLDEDTMKEKFREEIEQEILEFTEYDSIDEVLEKLGDYEEAIDTIYWAADGVR